MRKRAPSGGRNKIHQIIDKYDLVGIGDELEALWTRETKQRKSLRDLERYFNEQVVKEALARTEPSNPADARRVFEVLTAEDDTAAKTRIERRLERHGIDSDELREDFISYQTMRRYLTQVRGVEYNPAKGAETETIRNTVERLKTRMERVTEGKIDQLDGDESFSIGGGFRTSVSIHVYCPECGERFEFNTLLDSKGCSCE